MQQSRRPPSEGERGGPQVTYVAVRAKAVGSEIVVAGSEALEGGC